MKAFYLFGIHSIRPYHFFICFEPKKYFTETVSQIENQLYTMSNVFNVHCSLVQCLMLNHTVQQSCNLFYSVDN